MSLRDIANRVLFWIFVVPLLLLFAAIVPLAAEPRTPQAIAFSSVWVAFCLVAILVVYDYRRFWWATRAFTAVVFALSTSYLVYEIFFSEHPFVLFQTRGEASPRNALLFFISMGLPSLWYTLYGRTSLSPEKPPAESAPEEEVKR